jgi:hypothetical protein
MRLEYELRTEIEFWQDIIDTRPDDACEDTLDRVMLARSLAEKKLDLLLAEGSKRIN